MRQYILDEKKAIWAFFPGVSSASKAYTNWNFTYLIIGVWFE